MARAAVLAFSDVGPAGDDAPGADVEGRPVAAGAFRADLRVLDDVVVPGLVVAERAVDAVRHLAGELHRLGAAHGADVDRAAPAWAGRR